MARGPAAAAKQQLATTNKLGAGFNTQAGNLYSSLEPQLQAEATNPQGYSPADLNAMRTGARQAVGGSTAGITGQANLNVARTRNSAGYNAALDEAARTADQTNSQDELGIEAANANLKQQQQQTALSSLGNLYGTGVSAGESYYGMAPATINAWSNAGPPDWLSGLNHITSAVGDIGKIGGSIAGAIPGMHA